MEFIATLIENSNRDFLTGGFLGQEFADECRSLGLRTGRGDFAIMNTDKCPTSDIINQLGADVMETAAHRETRPGGRTTDFGADAESATGPS